MSSSPAPPAMQAAPILSVSGLSKRFGGLVALADYDLRLAAGTIHGVIGPNGAGKTTLFNLLSRMVVPTTGTIELDGQDITHLSSDRVARMGITRTFQNIRLFDDLTVLDNVKVGVQAHHPERLWATLLSRPSFRARETEIEARARDLLGLVGLAAGRITHGRQPPLRRPAPPRDRPRAGGRAAHPHARRAQRGHEPGGDRRAARPRPTHP